MTRPKAKKRSRANARTAKPSWRGILSNPGIILLVTFASLLLAGFGIVELRGSSLVSGTVALVVALALFVAASGRLSSLELSGTELWNSIRGLLPVGLLLVALFAAALAFYEVTRPRSTEVFQLSRAFWLVSLVLLVTGTLWLAKWRPDFRSWSEWVLAHRLEVGLLVLIFTAAVLARLYQLDQHPYPWSGDEATVGMEAGRIIDSTEPEMFNAGWSGNPFTGFYGTAAAVAALGRNMYAVRLASALVGALSVLCLYLLGRELFDGPTGLLAAAFLSTFPIHLQFSRVGVLTIQDTLVVTGVLWLVVRAIRLRRMSAFLWAGIASGLTFYTYVGGRLVLAMALGTLVLACLRERSFLRDQWQNLSLYLGATLVTLAPMAAFFMQHLQDFNSRFGQVSIFQSGWLQHELVTSGRSLLQIMGDQFTRSTLVYIAQPASGSFFNSPQPYLTLIGSLLFLIGMAIAFRQLITFPYTILLGWFWSVILIAGVFTISPPANTRMIMTAPAVALFVALGLTTVRDVVARFQVPAAWLHAGAAAIMAVMVVQNALFYFGPYRSGHYFDDANAEVAMQVGTKLQALGPKYTLGMIGLPRMFSGFSTIPFMAPDNPRIDIQSADAATVDLSQNLPVLLAATPDNETALRILAQRYPGGTWESVGRMGVNEALYFSYTVDATRGP